MDNNLCTSLITWLKTFPGHEDLTVSKLSDGVALGTILHKIAPEYFTHVWVSKINTDVATNWRLKASNLRKIHQGVVDYFYAYDLTGQTISQIPSPDLNKIVEQEDAIELGKLLQLILGCAINCVQKSKHIEAIMQMEEGMQALLMKAISDLMINQEVVPGSPDYTPVPEPSIPVSPSTLYPQFRILQEQLENVSVLKEDYERRCEELELQLSDSKKKNKELKEEKDKLEEKMENLESGGDMDVQNFRMKDLRKERDALQDELYKVESSRDDYRTRVEAFEKEISEINLRNEELQKSADKAIAYKDEADALRDHIERASILEGTVNTLKKKLEKMDDLKLQNRRLEEMNDDCVQQIVDLQDQVNNARDLRLQVDLYKKQGADLQQKLSDEEKKTQRQSFELNKLKEKLEAVTQEKERVLQDHHLLKDINEDLKCTVSALNSPDPGSKPHFDSDIDILCIPPEIREKFIRLQHENKNLKRKINSSESDPVQQTLYNDLQERYDKLLQENRWEKFSSPPASQPFYPRWPSYGRMWPPLDAYFMFDSPLVKSQKKLNILRRNLKWASESDLLILRQPAHANLFNLWSLNGSHGIHRRKSSSPLNKSISPIPSNTLPSNGKENPIVIHHIHEFKLAPSPTNEDSGCCRTSPSSFEGCEDHRSSGSYGMRTPDFGNTLDSGLSGMFRCLSPVIPSIVEECTSQHLSDILPAVLNEDGNARTAVMYHTHPSHNSHTVASLPHVNSSPPTTCTCFSSTLPGSVDSNFNKHFYSQISTSVSSPTMVMTKPPLAQQYKSDTPLLTSSNNKPNNLRLMNMDSEQSNLTASGSISQKKIEPPDSPTPHNSPRLPHSVYNIRLKGGKHPTSASSTSCGSGMEDIFVYPDIESRNAVSCDEIKPKQKHSMNAKTCQICQCAKENNSYKDLHKRYLETDLDLAFSNRWRSNARETNLDKLTGRLKSGIMNKVRSKSLDKYKSRGDGSNSTKSRVCKTSGSSLFMQDDEPVSSISLNKPIVSDDCLSYIPRRKNNIPAKESSHVSRSSVPVKESSQLTKENNRKSWGFENSLLYKSFRDKRFLSPVKGSADGQKSYVRSSGKIASSSSEILDSSSRDSLLSDEISHRNKRSGGVGSRSSKHPLTSLSTNFAECTCPPKEKLSNSASCHAFSSSTSLKRENKKPEVTLLTDTLFTHFVVSPKKKSFETSANEGRSRTERNPSITSVQSLPLPSPCPSRMAREVEFPSSNSRRKKSVDVLLSDTDTDLELLENRLVSSGFGAPLVSSESSSSILHSDANNTDFDPSATDYFTEPETEFNPHQFKLAAMTLEKYQQAYQQDDDIFKTKIDEGKDALDTEALIITSTHPVVYTGSYFKRKRKQMMASKTKILKGGIVKVKNKTAKAVVAETFNAMFTFCTP